MSKKLPIAKLLKLSPLALIANLAAALVAAGLHIPIVDVYIEGNDLVIVFHGGEIKTFPINYDITIKIDDTTDDEAVRLAKTLLGHDKRSPDDWQPDVEKFVK